MKVAIIGSGISGRAVFEYLNGKNIDCCFVNEKDLSLINDNKKNFDFVFDGVTYVIVSPGVKLDKNIKIYLKKKNIALFGELEFACSKINNDIIAVTGTNGKTTTVSLIHYLLKFYSDGVLLGGNIGIPVTSLIDKIKGEELLVLECSSFQLESVKTFRPHIAVVLNISEDHLNRHNTMSEYIRCKYKITKNQRSTDYLILNADDELIRKNPPKTKAQIFYFSLNSKVTGVYLKNNSVYFYDGERDEKLVSLSKIKLKGEHNISNILAAILAVYLQTGNISLLKNVSGFEGVSHRIEFVKKVKGIEFYNDSKATNIASVLVACKSFSQNILLILGGMDKGYDFDNLFKFLPKNIKYFAIFGECKEKIAFFARKYNWLNFYICDTLEQSVCVLFNKAQKGEVVLLSPACASFDQFSNYEERGNAFKKIVMNLDV